MLRFTSILLFFILQLFVAHAQENLFVVNCRSNTFAGKFYNPDLTIKRTIKFKIPKGAVPTSDPYHTSGDARAMRLSADGKKLYFFLWDGYEEGCEEPDEIPKPWTSFFCYDMLTKKLTKIFSPSRSGSLMWALFENRNSIVYYDYESNYLIEYNLRTRRSDSLYRTILSGSDNQLDAAGNSFDFHYVSNDTICRLSYNLDSRQFLRTPIYPYQTFSSARNGKTIIFFWPTHRSLVRVVQNGEVFSKEVSYNNVGTAWRDDTSFFVTEENGLTLYDYKLNKVSSLAIEAPHIYERLKNGLFIGFKEKGKECFGLVDFDLKKITKVKDIEADNFSLLTNY